MRCVIIDHLLNSYPKQVGAAFLKWLTVANCILFMNIATVNLLAYIAAQLA